MHSRVNQNTQNPIASKANSIVRWDKDQQTSNIIKPTLETYDAWQYAFDYFNASLFDDALPNPLITLTRRSRALGYFWGDKFKNISGLITHEISMNPAYLKTRDDREALSTLVHEMAHLWRHVHGPLNRRGGKGSNGYHDLVWAHKMEELGLLPTDTGQPDGNKIGNRVTHLIIDNGPFDVACDALLQSGYQIDWHDAISKPQDQDGQKPADATKKDRLKFTCNICELNAWAKPSAQLICAPCNQKMQINS